MAQSKILVGLEIGTTKTCMVVGEIRPDATATIIGIGEAKSAGVRKGEIVEPSMARQCVCDAWQLAQDHADVDILNVFLSVTGEHIVGQNNVGSFRLPDNEDIIEDEHADVAKEKAEKLELSTDRFCVNRELGGFSIDGGEPTRHPAGLTGRTLDVNCHIMHGIRTRLQNSLLCVRQVPLEVEDLVFAPLATAQMVLTRQQKDSGSLLIDIGGGTTDIAVISLSGVVESVSIKVAGDQFNESIVKYMRRKHNVLVGERTAELMKIQIGCVFPKEQETCIDVKGRCLLTGLPKTLSITSTEMLEAFEEPVERILEAIHGVLERTPPELVADISNNGIVMTGGGSLIDGFDKLVESRTGIQTIVAADAISCVAEGTGKSLESLNAMQDGTMNLSRRRQMN